VSFSSPFAQLAVSANLTWLSWVLSADASELAPIAYALPSVSSIAFQCAARANSVSAPGNPASARTGPASADFGGANWIPAPWDSILVAVIGLIGYEWGVRDAVRHLAAHPAPEPASTDPDADDSMDEFGAAPAG
jgi:hypothetical protein